jgi:hypothetical protein
MNRLSKEKKAAGGRPPKFREARRPITVTLPDRILLKLNTVNPDRAKAIVKCVEAVIGESDQPLKRVEMIEVLPGKALIVVGPCRSLARIDWLRLVEIAPARYLLVLPSGMPVENLELEILDLLHNLDSRDTAEYTLLKELCSVISHQRRQKTVSKAELVFVDIDTKG